MHCALDTRHCKKIIFGTMFRQAFRRALPILLLIAMSWQAMAMLNPLTVTERGIDPAHVAMHWQAPEHHHHGDQTLHLEESEGSTFHLHADGGLNSAGLVTAGGFRLAMPQPFSPPTAKVTFVPTRFLEGPLRPPRHTA
jgi:hypothetical protein